MQAFVKTHKADGVKAVLGMCGITAVPQASPEQLQWLHDVFASGQMPQG